MKLEKILEEMPPIDYGNLPEVAELIDKIIMADDLTEDDRSGFCTAFITGMAFAISAVQKGGVECAQSELAQRLTEWTARDWI